MQLFPLTQKITISKYDKFFFVNQETKIKHFLAADVKNNFNMHASFFMNSFVFARCTLELP